MNTGLEYYKDFIDGLVKRKKISGVVRYRGMVTLKRVDG